MTPKMLLAWCAAQNADCVILHGRRSAASQRTPGAERLVVASWFENHAYLWKGAAARRVAKRFGAAPRASPKQRLNEATQVLAKYAAHNATPAFASWQRFETLGPAGHYYAEDLQTVRRTLLEQGVSPRIILCDRQDISSLVVGKVTIHRAPARPAAMSAFVALLAKQGVKLEYQGEGLPALSSRALTALLTRKRRRKLNLDEKISLLKAQQYKCALCGEALSLGSVEFDHATPVCLSVGSEEAQTLQAVHATCHAAKTSEEERPLDRDPLTSHCSLDVFEQFVEAPIPPALVWCASESGL